MLPLAPRRRSRQNTCRQPIQPPARWTGAHGGLAFFAYSTNYLIDLDNAIIVDVEASTAIRQAKVTATKAMIDRVDRRFGLYPERLGADSAYGSAEMLNWLVGLSVAYEPVSALLPKITGKNLRFPRK